MGLLEDTGWYEMAYDQADKLYFGNGKGCQFLEDACNGEEQYSEFCYDDGLGCVPEGDKKALCDLQTFDDSCNTWLTFEAVPEGQKCMVI